MRGTEISRNFDFSFKFFALLRESGTELICVERGKIYPKSTHAFSRMEVLTKIKRIQKFFWTSLDINMGRYGYEKHIIRLCAIYLLIYSKLYNKIKIRIRRLSGF